MADNARADRNQRGSERFGVVAYLPPAGTMWCACIGVVTPARSWRCATRPIAGEYARNRDRLRPSRDEPKVPAVLCYTRHMPRPW